ncbi:MAG: hypothetical protein HY934_09730 [Candidatus Firestonebacteria bacterium]|nr:hypothetical protein [Candidatus Firestonebacteria bacterium]
MNTISLSEKDYCLSFIFNNPELTKKELLSYGFSISDARKLLSERSSSGGKIYSFDEFNELINIPEKELSKILKKIIKERKIVFKYECQVWKSWEQKPVVILIHGHGLSKKCWIDPYNEKIQDCNIKFKNLLTDYRHSPKEKDAGLNETPPQSAFLQFGLSKPLEYLELPPQSLWDFLKINGYNLITWSQKYPNQNIEKAIDELSKYVIPTAKKLFDTDKFIIIGHGRGGLVGRKYIEVHQKIRKNISGLIMLGTPNQGTNISIFNKELALLFSSLCIFIDEEAPLSSICSTILTGVPDKEEINMTLVDEAIEKQALMIKSIKVFFNEMRIFLNSDALQELFQTSKFIQNLKEEKSPGVYYASIYGSETTFTKMYLWYYKPTSFISHKNKHFQWWIKPKEIAKILDILEKLFPLILIPQEFIKGKGDGLVSVDSARWHLSDENHLLHLNHLDLLLNYSVKEKIIKILEKISTSC